MNANEIIENNIAKGHKLQYVVKATHLFASRPLKGSSFSFVGCTVSPGFDFKDFEMPSRDELLKNYPQHQRVITELSYI